MKNLIINLGPPGDVLRTTALLRVLDGEVYWASKKSCKDVLCSKNIKKVFFIEDEEDIKELKNTYFDKVISLNEESEALDLLQAIRYEKLIGVFKNKGGIDYTSDSSYWFDMSLSSKYGKEEADKRKFINKKSYPQILVEMVGARWSGQEYDLGIKTKISKGIIGVISVETGKWPNKLWNGFSELKEVLRGKGYMVVDLGMRPSISDHIEDINKCEVVVCGDTLGMHIALALKKKVIALFTCTSPNEIYGYNRMTKIISPVYEKYFYQKKFDEKAVSSISVEEVVREVEKSLKG